MKNPLSFIANAFCLFAVAISSQAALPKVQLQQIFPNFQAKSLTWMCEAPDGSGRFFVVAQDGIVYMMKKGSDGSDAKEFLNITNRHLHFEREDGLLSIAFHPGFKTNGLLYAYYTLENKPGKSQPEISGNELADKAIESEYPDIKKLDNGLPVAFPYRSVISEFKVSATDPNEVDMSSERVIFEVLQPFWNHKGALLQFGPDGYLYFGLGDGGRGDDPFGNGQNTATYLGKLLRIDVNTRATLGTGKRVRQLQYGIPSDNPFANELDMGGIGPKHEIWAYGFRNPWRYSFDRKNGALWVGDVGQDLWEEIDLVVKGGNYGWSIREAAHHFKPGITNGLIDPVIEYPHKPNLLSESTISNGGIGTSVTGGYVYRGKKFPTLDGIYIYADYTLGTIWGFRYDYDANKITEQGTLLQQKENITSFAEDNDGEVYALMENGHIYQIGTQ